MLPTRAIPAWLLMCGLLGLGLSASGCNVGGASTDAGPPLREDATPPEEDAGPPPPVLPGSGCLEAAEERASVGCEYWPTVTRGTQPPGTQFAILVANPLERAVQVEVLDAADARVAYARIDALGAETIVVPWVETGADDVPASSRIVVGGAYRLQSSSPVVAYQLNPLEGSTLSGATANNDASLLLPTAALGTDLVAAGWPPTATTGTGAFETGSPPSFLAITATQDGTEVTIRRAPGVRFLAGGTALDAEGDLRAELNRGDVLHLVTDSTVDEDGVLTTVAMDPSGSFIRASHPVQVIAGNDCLHFPSGYGACDHVEETVLPATSLGMRYVVPAPSGPHDEPAEFAARIVGVFDGTVLTYLAGPDDAPTTLDAGEVLDLGILNEGVVVESTEPVAIVTMLLSAQRLLPRPRAPAYGDPALSVSIPVEQYRERHVVFAPASYAMRWLDIVSPAGVAVRVDGQVEPPSERLGEFEIVRVALSEEELHVVEADAPVGLQVLGYDGYTSFQMPGGLRLDPLSPPPLF